MSLDISAYKLGEFLHAHYDENDDEDSTVNIFVNEHFSSHADQVRRGYYNVEEEYNGAAPCFSYGGYVIFRDELARIAGYAALTEDEILELADDKYRADEMRRYRYLWSVFTQTEEKGPVYELINFTDCEGVIGPKTAAKIATDLEALKEKVTPTPDVEKLGRSDRGFCAEFYKVLSIFKWAADNGGVVKFH